jgi:hypothetical protein
MSPTASSVCGAGVGSGVADASEPDAAGDDVTALAEADGDDATDARGYDGPNRNRARRSAARSARIPTSRQPITIRALREMATGRRSDMGRG